MIQNKKRIIVLNKQYICSLIIKYWRLGWYNFPINYERGIISMKLDFSDYPEAQDMISIIQHEKGLSAIEAIKFAINDTMYRSIVEAGWASIALSLWGHDDPEREWEIIENPNFDIELDESKTTLVDKIIKKEKVDLETAISYFLIFTMDSMGYHI